MLVGNVFSRYPLDRMSQQQLKKNGYTTIVSKSEEIEFFEKKGKQWEKLNKKVVERHNTPVRIAVQYCAKLGYLDAQCIHILYQYNIMDDRYLKCGLGLHLGLNNGHTVEANVPTLLNLSDYIKHRNKSLAHAKHKSVMNAKRAELGPPQNRSWWSPFAAV